MNREEISNVAKTLNRAGFSIHNYDAEKAKMILSDAKVSSEIIELFDKNAFEVFLELMKMQIDI